MKDWLGITSCVLAVPSAAVAILDLSGRLPQPFKAISPWIISACIGTAILWGMAVLHLRLVAPKVSWWLASRKGIAHRRQAEAHAQAEHYPKRMRLDPQMLEMSVWEFARRAELSVLEAWAILRNPDVIPQSDLWRQIEDALLLPPKFFERGKSSDGRKYGNEKTKARLEWYVTRGLATIHVGLDDPRLNPRRRASLVRKIERKLAKDLNDERGGGQ